MATINMEAIKIKVAKDQSGRQKAAAQARAEVIFEDAVIGMQKEFEEHSVTQEIEAGISSKNISETLRGGNEPENLYSFIGFKNGDNPVQPIRDLLQPENNKGPKLKFDGKEPNQTVATYKFRISTPDENAIFKKSPIPWATGLSWVEGIESGIAGFAHFLPSFTRKNSRSGGGIQVDPVLRNAEYTPPVNGYLTTIFQNFLERVKNYNKGGFRRRF